MNKTPSEHPARKTGSGYRAAPVLSSAEICKGRHTHVLTGCHRLALACAFASPGLRAQAQAAYAPPPATKYTVYPDQRGVPQPLQWEQLPPWMTLGMEVRGRMEGQTSFNYTQNGDRVYLLTRVYGSVEVRPNTHINGFLQFLDVHALGLPTHVVQSNMRDTFDARQAYLSLRFAPKDVPVVATVGRQQLRFGSERVIGISDWTNTSRTWDGIDLQIGSKNRLDLFSTSVVTVHPTALDKHGAGLTFHGAYGNFTTWIPKTQVQPYVLVRANPGVVSQQKTVGDQLETTFGAEVEGTLTNSASYIVNASLQRGSYSNDAIHAGQSLGKLYYKVPQLPWKPRLSAEYDYATGNHHRNPYRISTYDQQYPSNHDAFGLTDLFGYQNIRQERVNLDLVASHNLSFLLQGELLKLVSTRDNLYSGSGTTAIAAPAGGFPSGTVGTGIDFSGKYVFRNYMVANFGVGHLFPGGALMSTNHGAAETLGYFSLTYRYRVDKHAKDPNSQAEKSGASSEQ